MRKLLLLLLLVVLGCGSSEHNKAMFNIEKYLIAENIYRGELTLDSVTYTPKHKYLEEELRSVEDVYKQVLTGTDSSYLLIQLAEEKLDSVREQYLSVPKDVSWCNYHVSTSYDPKTVYNGYGDSIGTATKTVYTLLLNKRDSVIDLTKFKSY